MTSYLLPAELEKTEGPEYQRLRKMLSRDEAVQAIKSRRSKKIVQLFYEAGEKKFGNTPRFAGR